MNQRGYNYNIESASSTDVDDHFFYDMADPKPRPDLAPATAMLSDGSVIGGNYGNGNGSITNSSRKQNKRTVSFAGLELNQHGLYFGPGVPDDSSPQGSLEGSVLSIESNRDRVDGYGTGNDGHGYSNEYGGVGSTRRAESLSQCDTWGNPTPPQQPQAQAQAQARLYIQPQRYEQRSGGGGQVALYQQQFPQSEYQSQQIQEYSSAPDQHYEYAAYKSHESHESYEYVYSEEEVRAYEHQQALLAAAEAEEKKEQARLSLETRVSERIQSRYGGAMDTILRGRKPLNAFEQAVCIPDDPLSGVGAGAAFGSTSRYDYDPDKWNIQNPFYAIPAAQQKEKFLQEIPILPRTSTHRLDTDTSVYETFQAEAPPIYRGDGTKFPTNHLTQASFTNAGRGVAAMQLRLIFEQFAPHLASDVASILRSCDTAKAPNGHVR